VTNLFYRSLHEGETLFVMVKQCNAFYGKGIEITGRILSVILFYTLHLNTNNLLDTVIYYHLLLIMPKVRKCFVRHIFEVPWGLNLDHCSPNGHQQSRFNP